MRIIFLEDDLRKLIESKFEESLVYGYKITSTKIFKNRNIPGFRLEVDFEDREIAPEEL